MECECGWGGGKWPPASTESQRAVLGRWQGPTSCSRKEQGQEESEAGRGREEVEGHLRPQQIPEVAGKQVFDANIVP